MRTDERVTARLPEGALCLRDETVFLAVSSEDTLGDLLLTAFDSDDGVFGCDGPADLLDGERETVLFFEAVLARDDDLLRDALLERYK